MSPADINVTREFGFIKVKVFKPLAIPIAIPSLEHDFKIIIPDKNDKLLVDFQKNCKYCNIEQVK